MTKDDYHICTDAECVFSGGRSYAQCKCHVGSGVLIRAHRDALLEAAQALLNEETVQVHTGYDDRRNYVWSDAVLTSSDAFQMIRAAALRARSTSDGQ